MSSILWFIAHRYAVAATVGSLTIHAGVLILAASAPSPREFTADQVGVVAIDLSPAALAQIFPAAAELKTSPVAEAASPTETTPFAAEIEILPDATDEAIASTSPKVETFAETADRSPVEQSSAEQSQIEIEEKTEKNSSSSASIAPNTSAPSAQKLASAEAGIAAATSPEIIADSNRRPTYPEAARRRKQEGTVWLRLEIDARGDVRAATVDASSGYPLLDEAAVRAARQWRFRPANRFGHPADGTVSAPVEFRLK